MLQERRCDTTGICPYSNVSRALPEPRKPSNALWVISAHALANYVIPMVF